MSSIDRRSEAAPFTTLLCLIVEDETIIALTLEDAFLDAGHQVGGPFDTCADAEAWLTENSPSVAVVDAMLRDGPCHSLIRALRERQIPVLVFSGDMLDLEPADSIVFLSKPASFDTVVETATWLVHRAADRANGI